ncbi:NUDIX hydrolase [Limosilactobacillus mucosae]
MDLEEKTIDQQTVFKGHVVDVELQHVKTPQGNIATREIVRHAPAIALLVIGDDQKMILEKQWRAPVQNITWEIPAGKLDERDHGDARHAAIRELNEETRLQAGELTKITAFYSSVGFCDEYLTLYQARNLKPVEHALPQDQDEDIKLYRFSLDEALKMIETGAIEDSKTIVAVYYWQAQTLAQKLKENHE